MAWRFRGDRRWGRADLLALGAGIFGLFVFGTLFVAVDDNGGHLGLVQRLSLGAGAVWVGALALGLLTVHGRLPGTPLLRSADAARR